MVLLVQKLASSFKHSSKLENHHHHHHHHRSSETLSVSLQAFKSDATICLTKLSTDSEPGYEFVSLKWIQQCLEAIPIVNKAFAKLVVELNYPMNKWLVSFVEEYLNYSLSLLEFLNSINSAASRLSRTRCSMSRTYFLEKLKPLEKYKNFQSNFKVNDIGGRKEKFASEKEVIFHKALVILENTGLWLCGAVLSGLCSDFELYKETTKLAGGLVFPALIALDSSACEKMMENRGIIRELKEVNDAVANGENAMGLKTRIVVIEEMVKGIEEEANKIFSEVLAGRNEMINILRQQKLY